MKIFISAVFALIILSGAALAYTYPKEMDKPWDHSPITFSVNKTFPPECDPSYLDDFYKSIEYWENGGNGRLSYQPAFKEVDGKADIPVRWVKTVQNVSEEVGGIAYLLVIPNEKFVNATIQLACVGIFETNGEQIEKEFSHREMQVTAMHELGHTLGLEHTDDKNDIMSPKQSIKIYPISFETSSFGVDLNVSERRIMPGDIIVFSGKTEPNIKLDFVELYNKSRVSFEQKRVVADSEGNFRNSATFDSVGRYVVEMYNPLSPQVYASTTIFVEAGADVQVNSKVPAEVYVNSTLKGVAPFKLENLKYGTYEINCKASGYRDYKTYLTVVAGTTTELKADTNRDAVLCALENEGGPAQEKRKGFFEKLSLAIKEFFRILFSQY